MIPNPIETILEEDAALSAAQVASGPISKIAQAYNSGSDRLLGFLLELNYEEMRIITCDAWKHKCGGVPRNSFVIVKINPKAVSKTDIALATRVILARVTESVPTPVASDVQSMIFEVHKVQAIVDPITNKELQWHALRASVLGTYYDETESIAFGNDVDTFLAAHSYEVFVPTDNDLAVLLNSFVKAANPLRIGVLRYTETPPLNGTGDVPIMVDADDFIGTESGNRTALFGKTRMGKSNAIKVIGDTILRSKRVVGQVFFDPSGEYTYYNPQDKTSLYLLHRKSEKCVRYSLTPKLPPEEKDLGLTAPKDLRVNFYESVSVGVALIQSLFTMHFSNVPNYLQPLMNWSPLDPKECPTKMADAQGFNYFWRTMAMWYAALRLADYDNGSLTECPVELRENVKQAIVNDDGLKKAVKTETKQDGSITLATKQPVSVLPRLFKKVAELHEEHETDPKWFPMRSDGLAYYNNVEQMLLRILRNDGTISGHIYLTPFKCYHSVTGSNTFVEIAKHVDSGRTVFIDFAKADEAVREALSERICRAILLRQMEHFSNNTLTDKWVVFYFEEAHTLFRADDKDLKSIYNKLAKEGAKFHIAMVYATQSMTTMSPDLLKNTENFIIGHLNDDREVKEVTRRYEFREIAEDVQRIRSKGFVRMITLSHRFALPVQIRKFEGSESDQTKRTES